MGKKSNKLGMSCAKVSKALFRKPVEPHLTFRNMSCVFAPRYSSEVGLNKLSSYVSALSYIARHVVTVIFK